VTLYVAPARYALTCLHRQDPAIPPVTAGPDPADGATVCGLPMLATELWGPVDGRDGDTLCTGCMPRSAGQPAEPEPEGMLF
jgi:hypothetical protein